MEAKAEEPSEDGTRRVGYFTSWNLIGTDFRGSRVRTLGLILAIAVLVSLLYSTSVLGSGVTSDSVLGSQKLGADMILLPSTRSASFPSFESAKGAIYVVSPSPVIMNKSVEAVLATIPGIANYSAQLFIGFVKETHGTAVLSLIAFDPNTDFSIRSWANSAVDNLGPEQGLGGAGTNLSIGDSVQWENSTLTIVDVLPRTNTTLDRSILVSFQTAYSFADSANYTKLTCFHIDICNGQVSGVMIKLSPGVSPQNVEADLVHSLSLFTVVERSGLISRTLVEDASIISYENIIEFFLVGAFSLLAALAYSMTLHERRRQLALLRSFGASRRFIFRIVLTEGVIIALIGGAVGLGIGQAVLFVAREYLTSVFKLGFLDPGPYQAILIGGLAVILGTVLAAVATVYPAFSASRHDTYDAIRGAE